MLEEEGYNPNEIDSEGYTPLALHLKGKRPLELFYSRANIIKNIFYLLVKNKADVNFVYPEKSFKPAFNETEVDD